MFYGQQPCDFDNGVMYFLAPNQVLRVMEDQNPVTSERSGWIMMIHPDFLWNTPLAKNIHNYEFFDYSVNEVEKTVKLTTHFQFKLTTSFGAK